MVQSNYLYVILHVNRKKLLILTVLPEKGQAQMGSAQTNQKPRKFTWKAIMKSTTGAVRY